MKLKKMATGLAIASASIAFSSTSLALECSFDPDAQVRRDHLVGEIMMLAKELRCEKDDGYWDDDHPIWQYKGTKGDGCIVHARLATQLHEERTFDEGDKPPRNKHGTNDAAGAANDIENGKDDAAALKLTSFIETILYDYANKLNEPYGDNWAWATSFAYAADAALACIADL